MTVPARCISRSAALPFDGREVLAYMPESVVKRIHNSSNGGLDYSSRTMDTTISTTPRRAPAACFMANGFADRWSGCRRRQYLCAGCDRPDRRGGQHESLCRKQCQQVGHLAIGPITAAIRSGSIWAIPMARPKSAVFLMVSGGRCSVMAGALANDVANGNCSAPPAA